MDDHVLRGMAKWPNVPAVYGWLTLDRRGQWLIKGDRVVNSAIADFIGRNYERDSDGNWYFQNGPQRVFVELEYAPFVLRAVNTPGAPLDLAAHTGAKPRELRSAWLDEHGSVLLETELGLGVLDDRDLDVIAAAFVDAAGKAPDDDALDALIDAAQRGTDPDLWIAHDSERVKIRAIASGETGPRFGYHPSPTAPAGHPEC
jgi:hypothetical protein